MKKLCVFCGSGFGNNPVYRTSAQALAKQLLLRNIGLLYGGTHIGMMGSIADAMLEQNGYVQGIIPQTLYDRQLAHTGLSELQILPNPQACKAAMTELAHGFMALPGGFGTLDELFELLTEAQLGHHEKPCAVLNVNGYYDDLIRFLSHAEQEQFIKPYHMDLLLFDDSVNNLLDTMNL